MDELAQRRHALFSGSDFPSALLYSGDEPGGTNASFRYFAGFEIDGTYLVLRKNGGTLLAHGMNYSMAKSLSHYPVKLLSKNRAQELRAACGRGKVGFAPGELSAARYLALKKSAKLKLADATGRIEKLRSCKSPSELSAMAASARLARKILDSLDPWECKTELELASRLKSLALAHGAQAAFEPIVATGKNSSFPHHIPAGKKLGDAVLVDFGVRLNGYCSDFTRCYFRRKGMKEEETYGKCADAFWNLLALLPECENGSEVAAASQSLLRKRHLPALPHAIGHGIGLEVHECPHLWPKSRDALPEGTVLAIEPAAYFSAYGARFEEMAVRAKGGWKLL